MNLNEWQEQISRWGRETFGTPKNARDIATRMNCEVAELLEALGHLPPAGLDRADALKAIGLECADVLIMLVQVADALDLDLEDLTAEKFTVNQSRSWQIGPNGKTQHVDPAHTLPELTGPIRMGTFVDEGSGATLRFEEYYVRWDNGGLVLRHGFPDTRAAVAAATRAGYNVGLCVPTFLDPERGWEGLGQINVVKGGHLALVQGVSP